jgi:diguanylate cyclase (GGDEF)-like protein
MLKLNNENKRLRKLAQKDPLTGLFNRRYIIDKTEEEFYQLYTNKPFSILSIDIDFFKNVNDNYGHDAGDFVLKEFAKIITEEIREQDVFGRTGGEEFALILSNTSFDKVKSISERIRIKIQDYNFKHKNNIINITISIGVCYFNNIQETTFENCLKCSDKALYQSKKNRSK